MTKRNNTGTQGETSAVSSHFATLIGAARPALPAGVNDDIIAAALSFASDDEAGARWSAENAYTGYTSYGSGIDLCASAPCFRVLRKALEKEAASFADACGFDLSGGAPKLDNIWINVMERGGFHSGHIHPHSVISGTYYAQTPKNSAAIKFEDPRLPMMMAAPPRREGFEQFHYVRPEAGLALFWESWLRHEVVRNEGKNPRISVSFNYRWS
jgi:uncharacterized protein (TIGR02466 family)